MWVSFSKLLICPMTNVVWGDRDRERKNDFVIICKNVLDVKRREWTV